MSTKADCPVRCSSLSDEAILYDLLVGLKSGLKSKRLDYRTLLDVKRDESDLAWFRDNVERCRDMPQICDAQVTSFQSHLKLRGQGSVW